MPKTDAQLRGLIGTQVRHWRKLRGLSQADLGHRAGLTGESISRLERGLIGSTAASLLSLANALDVNVADLAQPNWRGDAEKRLWDRWSQLHPREQDALLVVMDQLLARSSSE